MRITLLTLTIFFTIQAGFTQKLEKLRLMCSDVVDISTYKGELSTEELQNQYHQIGFQYVENGTIKFHDELVVYDCNTGKVRFSAEFDMGVLIKKFKSFYPDGSKHKELILKQNIKEPIHSLFLRLGSNRIKATPVGTAKIYHQNGKLKQKINFSKGNQYAKLVEFNQEGDKISKGTAILSGDLLDKWNLSKNGEWAYFENAILTNKKSYLKNKVTAEKIIEGGVLTQELQYEDGKLIQSTAFHPNGKVKYRGSYNAGKKNGEWISYYKNGKPKSKVHYEDDSILEESELDKNGVLIASKKAVAPSKLGLTNTGQEALFQITEYQDGLVQSKYYKLDTLLIGEKISYNSDGSIASLEVYSLEGNLEKQLDGETFAKIDNLKKATYRELLTAHTFYPINVTIVNSVEQIEDSIGMEIDSLSWINDYENYYLTKIDNLERLLQKEDENAYSETFFKNLNEQAQKFTDKNFEYHNKLQHVENKLQIHLALSNINNLISEINEKYTYQKKTLFGKKVKVKNEKENLYYSFVEEIIPEYQRSIKASRSSEGVLKRYKELVQLKLKFEEHFEDKSKNIERALKDLSQVEDKKEIILTSTTAISK